MSGISDEDSLVGEHVLVVSIVELACGGVDEESVGSVSLRTELLEEGSEALVHGRVDIRGVVTSGEVVEMWEDSVAVGLANGMGTCAGMGNTSYIVSGF
ncbi:hypothetical protein R1flu_017976 [Riccia fluitans]|uniref:Uncharacterized protein n=1 Tax=Riccia fluitans TaxID=41844 RepID=A0ABD1ZER7_9MARC